MNDQNWERIQRNWSGLQDVHPKIVTDRLFQDGVLDPETAARGFDTITELLNVLKSLRDSGVFEKFMDALKTTGYETLAEKIIATNVSADPTVKARGDPTLFEPEAREVLLCKFKVKKDAEVSLLEVREELQRNNVFRDVSWKDQKISHFLQEIFNGIEVMPPQRKRMGGKRIKVILVKNLCKATDDEAAEDVTHPLSKDPNSGEPVQKSEVSLDNQGIRQTKKVSLMSLAELKQHLLPKMVEKQLPTDCLDIFEEQNITGPIFLTLKEKHIAKILPKATFGVCRFLQMQVEQSSEQTMVTERMETLRRFDSPVTHLTVYHKGLCCNISSYSKDKTTIPIKLFFPIVGSSKREIPELIASEVVPFASACLNQRRNGTIYFGIANSLDYKPGEIVGIFLDKSEIPLSKKEERRLSKGQNYIVATQQTIQSVLNYFLQHSFLDCHQEIIKHSVRDAKFVPVIEKDNVTSSLYVVEVDVKSSSELLKNKIILTLLKLLPIHGRKRKIRDGLFAFSHDGKAELLDLEARHNFESNHGLIVDQRNRDERADYTRCRSVLRKKLLKLLTGEDEGLIEKDMFFFVVLSPLTHGPSSRNSDSKTNVNAEILQFIENLDPEIVFDFDPHGWQGGVYSLMKTVKELHILTTDNFDDCKRSKEEMIEQEKSLASESKLLWFFCNGYSPLDIPPLSPVDWTKARKVCFQEGLRSFISIFRKDRIAVLICLISKDCDIIVDASGEILANLSDNWMVLAESEDVAKHWQSQVLQRHWVSEEDLDDRCVIGMPWNHVIATIQQAKQPLPSNTCYLPTATGAFIDVKEEKISDWYQINVLSATFKPEQDNDKEKVEENFYSGKQAQWENFYYKTQVLVRDKHKTLMSLIEKALKRNGKGKRNKVAVVELIHQPMAGGTTSAKQALWDLREEYRCCEVKAFTEHTVRDLNELHRYGEKKPKPVLVLIDNLDKEKVRQLLEELEDQGQKSKSFDVDETYEVYFVAIICIRNTSVDRRTRLLRRFV